MKFKNKFGVSLPHCDNITWTDAETGKLCVVEEYEFADKLEDRNSRKNDVDHSIGLDIQEKIGKKLSVKKQKEVVVESPKPIIASWDDM